MIYATIEEAAQSVAEESEHEGFFVFRGSQGYEAFAHSDTAIQPWFTPGVAVTALVQNGQCILIQGGPDYNERLQKRGGEG